MFKRFVDSALSGPLCLVFLISLIWQLSVPAPAQAQPQSALNAKNVLVLYSEDKAHPAHELTDRGIRAAFYSNKLFNGQLYTEYLDLSRFSRPANARVFADYLRRKYAGIKIDTIITIYLAALDFLTGKEGNVFPGVPIVACEIDRSTAENLERSPLHHLITGVILGDNTEGVLDSAFRMKPGTKRIALVAGTSPSDVFGEMILPRGLTLYARKLDLIDLTKLPMQEILARVGSLPPDTIVLYSAIFLDGAGQSFVPREALALISRAANAPVFGLYESFLGYGIVGGRLVSFEQQGREAAALALRIMGGESPASIPFGGEQAYVNLYDWRELKRWGLNESPLPADAMILNKPVSAWEMYKPHIIGALVFCLAEAALIVFLLAQRRRKKVAEENLRQKKEELDQFFNVTLDLLCIANTDGYFQRLNPAWERVLGYTREELMTKRFLEFVHPDDLGRTQERVSTLASQQKVFSFENRYRCKDGTYRWLEWTSAPAGNLIYTAARDITERKRAEEALQESKEAAQEMAREASVLAEIGRIISSTLIIEDIYERFSAEAKKIILFDRILINVTNSAERTVINVYIAGEEVQDRETGKVYPLEGSGNAEMLRTKSTLLLQTEDFKEYGDRFPMLASTFQAGFRSIMNVPLISKGEVIGGLLLRSRKPYAYKDKDVVIAEKIANQISNAVSNAQLFQERKRTEEALQISEEKFRQFFNNTPDYCYIISREGNILHINEAALKTLGYKQEELVGQPLARIYAPESLAKMKDLFTQWKESGQIRDEEMVIVTRKGERRVVILNAGAVKDKNGTILHSTSVQTDITDRQRAEAEVARAHAELLRVERSSRLSELTASLAHELNQPLAAILSNAQAALHFLKSDKPDLNEFQEIIRDIISDDQRAGNVIRSLRSMMKREEGEKRATVLNDILNDVIQIFRSEAIFRNVYIETELDGSLPPVIGDKGQVENRMTLSPEPSPPLPPDEQFSRIRRSRALPHHRGAGNSVS